jgi:hypothetical protein
MTYSGDNGLSYEYNLEKSHSVKISITDIHGNYVVIILDLENSNNSKYLDVKLPITLQSAGIVIGEKGYQYTTNELIDIMNKIYLKIASFDDMTMMSYANTLLLEPKGREHLIKQAVKIYKK